MYIINKIIKSYNTQINSITNIPSYSIVKNYENIVKNSNYIKPQIAENIVLESGHTICIIKTIWLKLIQRTWKKIYALRKATIAKRCKYESIRFREITGRWPKDFIHFPSLNGMISSLKKY